MLLAINFDFSLIDADAIVICVVGYVIVFSALVLLYFVFNNLPKILKIKLSLNKLLILVKNLPVLLNLSLIKFHQEFIYQKTNTRF